MKACAKTWRRWPSLDYPDYELLVAARSAADIPPGVLPRRARVVLAHGGIPDQREGPEPSSGRARHPPAKPDLRLRRFRGRVTRALAARPGRAARRAGRGSLHRLSLVPPGRPRSGALMRSVWDAVVRRPAGARRQSASPGAAPWPFAGRRSSRIGVFDHWKNAVSDDYTLSAAMHAAGSADRLCARRAGALLRADRRARLLRAGRAGR